MEATPRSPTLDEINKLVAKAAEVRTTFRVYSSSKRVEDKKHKAKFRPGGGRIVRLVSDIADSMGFEVPGAPTAAMREALEHSTRLEPLHAELDPLARVGSARDDRRVPERMTAPD